VTAQSAPGATPTTEVRGTTVSSAPTTRGAASAQGVLAQGQLPFTGSETWAIGLAGLALLAGGLLARRRLAHDR
jgi:LPXTG-motif cell wall-anchored protein